MNTLSKLSLAALGGLTVLMVAGSADAATGRYKFRASIDEVRRYCERIDEDFWRSKRNYGCGEKIGCVSGSCRAFTPPPPPPPPTYQPPTAFFKKGGGNGPDGGKKAGGGDNGGGGKGGSGAAGGPN